MSVSATLPVSATRPLPDTNWDVRVQATLRDWGELLSTLRCRSVDGAILEASAHFDVLQQAVQQRSKPRGLELADAADALSDAAALCWNTTVAVDQRRDDFAITRLVAAAAFVASRDLVHMPPWPPGAAVEAVWMAARAVISCFGTAIDRRHSSVALEQQSAAASLAARVTRVAERVAACFPLARSALQLTPLERKRAVAKDELVAAVACLHIHSGRYADLATHFHKALHAAGRVRDPTHCVATVATNCVVALAASAAPVSDADGPEDASDSVKDVDVAPGAAAPPDPEALDAALRIATDALALLADIPTGTDRIANACVVALHRARTRMLRAQGEYANALVSATRVAELDPSPPTVAMRLELLLDCGLVDDATAALCQLCGLQGSIEHHAASHALTLAALGRERDAMRALAAIPHHDAALACLYFACGVAAKAVNAEDVTRRANVAGLELSTQFVCIDSACAAACRFNELNGARNDPAAATAARRAFVALAQAVAVLSACNDDASAAALGRLVDVAEPFFGVAAADSVAHMISLRGHAALHTGDIKVAAASVATLLDLQPHSPDTQLLRCRVALRTNNFDEAAACVASIARLTDRDAAQPALLLLAAACTDIPDRSVPIQRRLLREIDPASLTDADQLDALAQAALLVAEAEPPEEHVGTVLQGLKLAARAVALHGPSHLRSSVLDALGAIALRGAFKALELSRGEPVAFNVSVSLTHAMDDSGLQSSGTIAPHLAALKGHIVHHFATHDSGCLATRGIDDEQRAPSQLEEVDDMHTASIVEWARQRATGVGDADAAATGAYALVLLRCPLSEASRDALLTAVATLGSLAGKGSAAARALLGRITWVASVTRDRPATSAAMCAAVSAAGYAACATLLEAIDAFAQGGTFQAVGAVEAVVDAAAAGVRGADLAVTAAEERAVLDNACRAVLALCRRLTTIRDTDADADRADDVSLQRAVACVQELLLAQWSRAPVAQSISDDAEAAAAVQNLVAAVTSTADAFCAGLAPLISAASDPSATSALEGLRTNIGCLVAHAQATGAISEDAIDSDLPP